MCFSVSRGESETEEKRNISNVSSKGSTTSFTNIITPPHQFDEVKRTTDRRPKVSFATDESTSFESSPRNRLAEQAKKSHKHRDDLSYKIDGYSGFIRETTALRAAMDYGGDEEENDDIADLKPKQYTEQLYQQNQEGKVLQAAHFKLKDDFLRKVKWEKRKEKEKGEQKRKEKKGEEKKRAHELRAC